MKRILIMLLMALMLGCCFVSCDNKTPESETATEENVDNPSEGGEEKAGDQGTQEETPANSTEGN